MFIITEIDSDGRINFYSKNDTHNVTITIRSEEQENTIYTTNFSHIHSNISYFIGLSPAIIPYLRDVYVEFSASDVIQREEIIFPRQLLDGYNIYGNSCLAWRIYEAFNTIYTSPTIGNLFLDDNMYINFCENIDRYLNVEMEFGGVRNNDNFKKQTGTVVMTSAPIDYPISHHLDIDIHWIHPDIRYLDFPKDGVYEFIYKEKKPLDKFKEEWRRRVDRGVNNEKIFVWSASEFFNIHGDWERKQLIDRFKQLPHRSVLLTERKEEEYEDDYHVVRYMPIWENNHQLQRIYDSKLIWNNQGEESKIFKKIINDKWLKRF
jgi:uncharacterized protein (DUF1919 family)